MRPDTRIRSALGNVAWPPFPGQGAAQKLAILFGIELAQWRRPEEILADQFLQLRELVDFAVRTVPHYRRTIDRDFVAGGLDPQKWRDLPVLTRRMLHESGFELRSEGVPREHGPTFAIKTSGSTGMMVEVLGTALTELFWQVFCLRDHLWHRRDLSATLCSIRYQRDSLRKGPEGHTVAGWGPATDDVARTGMSINYDILLSVEHLAQRLLVDRPGYLLSHPSLVGGLARHCLEKRIELPGLLEIRSMGETIDDSLRELCREAWRAPLVDMYSCQEAGYLALQCPDHPHYHVQSENVLLEVVDAAGRACGPGEVGRILISSLNNFATPLIRYEVGDCAEVGEPCPCGRGLPVLKRILGRYRNLLTMPDGTNRWPRLGYESRLQEVAPIELLQMVQTGLEDIDVKIIAPRELVETEIRSLSAFIHEKLGYPFRLRFEYADSIRNQGNGKVEQFISLLG